MSKITLIKGKVGTGKSTELLKMSQRCSCSSHILIVSCEMTLGLIRDKLAHVPYNVTINTSVWPGEMVDLITALFSGKEKYSKVFIDGFRPDSKDLILLRDLGRYLSIDEFVMTMQSPAYDERDGIIIEEW